jgi:hypothetical protein
MPVLCSIYETPRYIRRWTVHTARALTAPEPLFDYDVPVEFWELYISLMCEMGNELCAVGLYPENRGVPSPMLVWLSRYSKWSEG